MLEPQSEARTPSTELVRINTLAKKYETELGPMRVTPVGKAGYIVERGQNLPMAGNDWVMYDYDDTIAATSEVKQRRKELYLDYAKNKLHLSISDESLETILESTDAFSRWEDKPGAGKSYHANIHMSALTWLTEEIERAAKAPDFDADQFISNKITQLDRIKSQRETDNPDIQTGDPFHFRTSDRTIVIANKRPWSHEVEVIFTETMINPPHYKEVIDAAKEVAGPKDSIHRTNIGMFSYGDPYYQFLKICELLKVNPEFPVSQIWITAVPKGEFIKEAVLTKATQYVEMGYVPQRLEDSDEDSASMSYGSGYPIGQHQHVMILFDDSVKEAESVLATNTFLKGKTGAQFVVVRSLRSGTKEENKIMKVQSPYGTVDFRNGTLLPKDVAGVLKVNQYLARKSKVREGDQTLLMMKDELVKSYGFDPATL